MFLRRLAAFLLVVFTVLPSLLIATPGAATAQSTDDAQAFNTYLDAIESETPIAGPLDGDLAFAKGDARSVTLGVSLSDFVMQADLVIPAVAETETWAAAVAFRQSGTAFHYLVIWSDGSWSFAPANGGPVSTGTGVAIGTPGELLHLSLIATGDRALIGLGGQYLATLDLSTHSDPGDISLSAGLIGQESEQLSLSFQALTVWELPSIAAEPAATATTPPQQESPVAAATAVPETPIAAATVTSVSEPADDAAVFNAYLAQALSLPVLYGPENGTITHEPDSVSLHSTGVSAANFVARVECLSGMTSADGYWDCGFIVRGSGSDSYWIVYVSDGYWSVSLGANEPLVSGLDAPVSASADSKIVINLIADGDIGYLGFNDQYMATLDLSALQTAGEIKLASAFFTDTTIENGGVDFEDLIVWSLDESGVTVPTPTTGAVEQPSPTVETATVAPAQPTPAANPTQQSGLPGVTGNSFTSPTFGYSLNWSESWTVTNANVSPAMDIVELGNGVVQADLIGETWDLAGGSCFDRLVQYYEGEPAYSDIRAAADSASVVPGVWEITGILTMTFTDESGTATTYVDYAACSAMPDQSAIVSLEQFVPLAEFAAQSGEMDLLRAGFTPAGSTVAPVQTPATTMITPTPIVGAATITPTTGVPPVAPTATAGQTSNVVGNTYTSPTFGYSLTWNDSWSVVNEDSAEGVDFLRISSGTLVADLYAAASTNTPVQCIDELFNYYANDELFANVIYVAGADGQPLRQDFGTYATGVISFTQTLSSGETIDQFSEAVCYRMEDLGAVVLMEIYMAPSDYLLQRSAITTLQSGLVIPGQPTAATTPVVQTPIAQPTSGTPATVVAPPPGGNTQTATFLLQPVNSSGITGTGTLEAQNRLVIVSAIVLGAQPGDTITIQRGGCSALGAGVEPDYIVGELDDTGLLREEVRVRIEALTGAETYAVVVYSGSEDFSRAIACGDIS